MGAGRMSAASWDTHTTTRTAGKATHTVFSSRAMKETLDPKKIVLRESCDSVYNPRSTPIIIGLDVTGSMGIIPDYFVREGLKPLFEEIYTRRPVSDPAICLMGIGDVVYDRAPLQVSQFESDIRIADQLMEVFLEGGGGGNSSESYTLAWYFASMKTKLDSYTKRKKKGFIFTIGDEEPPKRLLASELEKVFGAGQYEDLTSEQLLEMASRYFHVFHIIIEEGSHCRHDGGDRVFSTWKPLLGQRVIRLSDYKKLAEVIVSAIQVTEGDSVDTVTKSWSGDTSVVVSKAINGLVSAKAGTDALVEF
jgi:hypothetical protein